MSKTILANVDGFTPVIDGMIPEVGAMTALIFGKAWRYCQMADGVCKAAQDRIADELGLSRATINTHFAKLVEFEYLEDLTPDLLGFPHEYRDTGKANLSISFTGGVKNIDRGCQNSLQGGVKNIDTKKVLKKEKEKEEEQAQVFRAYSSEIGMITPMIADSINEWIKDGFPVKWMCDAIHEAALQNKRNWKYCEAIIKRWDAQGSQEAMTKPQGKPNTYKPRDLIQERYGGIMEWLKEAEANDNNATNGDINGANRGGVPQLKA